MAGFYSLLILAKMPEEVEGNSGLAFYG